MMPADIPPPPPPSSTAAAPPPPPPPAVEATPTPEKALFTHKYGFIDEESGFQYDKLEGATETNPSMIRKLIDRKAPIITDPIKIQLWQMKTDERREKEKRDLDARRAPGRR